MPTTKSAKKRLRQSLERRAVNRAGRSKLKTLIKRVHSAVEAGKPEDIKSSFQSVQKGLDQAASKGLIHPNAAARVKSRLTRQIKKKTAAKS